MAVAIFAAATLGVCASGRYRGLGAGRRRALTIHEPRAPIGRKGGGARQGPPLCFRPAVVARRRCGACPEGMRGGDGLGPQFAMWALCRLWPSRIPGPGGTPRARVLAPSLPALFRPGVWPGQEATPAARGASRKETPSQASITFRALCGRLVRRGRAHAGPRLP